MKEKSWDDEIKEMFDNLPKEMQDRVRQGDLTPSEMIKQGRITQQDIDEIHAIAVDMHDILVLLH